MMIAINTVSVACDPITQQCKGTTTKNVQCARKVTAPATYCHQHDPNATKNLCGAPLKGKRKDGRTTCSMKVSKPGQRCHHHA